MNIQRTTSRIIYEILAGCFVRREQGKKKKMQSPAVNTREHNIIIRPTRNRSANVFPTVSNNVVLK